MKQKVKILGTGSYVPKRVVKAEEIDALIGKTKGWSEKKSGVKQRFFVESETASYMAAEAAKLAIEDANISLSDLDCIVSASGTNEQAIPCNAALIQKQLELQDSGIPCFDFNSTCLSFVTALDIMSYAIDQKRYQYVLIVSSEISSVGLNWSQHESSILFGDGACAFILTHSDESSGIIASKMETYSEGAEFSEIRGGGTKIRPRNFSEQTSNDFFFDMNGRAIFKLSYKRLPEFLEGLFEQAQLSMKDMQMVIPHQASASAMKIIRKKLDVKEERFMSIIEEYGNVIAASIPLAFHEALRLGKLKRGDLVLLLGTSAGLSIGGIVLEY